MKHKKMDDLINRLLPFIDASLIIFAYIFGHVFKKVRKIGIHKFPRCKKVFLKIGFLPIIDHYYEPLFDAAKLRYPLSSDRNLPGIDWNISEQLAILSKFSFNEELVNLPSSKPKETGYYFNNGAYESGDAEYWYNIIRLKKPRTIIEIGSGYSTLMAIKAVAKNKEIDIQYECSHICIEPYEKPWLETLQISVVRKKVEEIDLTFFKKLQQNDILFIDSSHVIRPQGDVLFECLEILPILNKGVIVHIHDIFSPKDYLDEWVKEDIRLWNEQYLLEAFLSNNQQWKIIGALNLLHHHYFNQLKDKCPYLNKGREPGSFYIQKVL